ncbi:hypothetical protein DFH07DRAFT_824999 [Mycena maculata]|uniref:Uncharacterized protein n=1 Tax=Mycena maculata TaxID=230809 RepID=A0AAD7NAP4_9AGAR|nr:hypothetical protein DFH07DRAFT_824999 [Mycena maculata]
MAAEPRPQRPGSSIRPQTRDKVVEILAGNANGCLAELGYTPALLQRVQWLEGVVTHLKNANADLLKTHTPSEERQRGDEYKRQAGELRAMYDKLQADFTEEMAKSTRYQGECLKLYEDNVKLSADCDALREQVKVAQERITAYEKTRDMNANQILEQYGNLQANYRKAVGELQWYAAEAKNASVKINTRGGGAPQPWQAQPQHRHLASTQVLRPCFTARDSVEYTCSSSNSPAAHRPRRR